MTSEIVRMLEKAAEEGDKSIDDVLRERPQTAPPESLVAGSSTENKYGRSPRISYSPYSLKQTPAVVELQQPRALPARPRFAQEAIEALRALATPEQPPSPRRRTPLRRPREQTNQAQARISEQTFEIHDPWSSRPSSPLLLDLDGHAAPIRNLTDVNVQPLNETSVPSRPGERCWPSNDGFYNHLASSMRPIDNLATSNNMTRPNTSHTAAGQNQYIMPADISVFGRFGVKSPSQFTINTVPRELYMFLLLGLPRFYFSRVKKVFDEAEISRPDIIRMYTATAKQWQASDKQKQYREQYNLAQMPVPNWNLEKYDDSHITPALMSFKESWEGFIDSLLREWKTLNLISALLLSAVLTLLQIDGVADDPLTRTACVLSLLCGLMSILYSCLYIIRFGPMRSMHKAASWSEESKRGASVLWNVWALLAMPAVWLAWSLISFIVATMSYVWRTNSEESPLSRSTPNSAALGIRIATTSVLGLGCLYLVAMLRTFSRYGFAMDRAWKRAIVSYANKEWHEQQGQQTPIVEPFYYRGPGTPIRIPRLPHPSAVGPIKRRSSPRRNERRHDLQDIQATDPQFMPPPSVVALPKLLPLATTATTSPVDHKISDKPRIEHFASIAGDKLVEQQGTLTVEGALEAPSKESSTWTKFSAFRAFNFDITMDEDPNLPPVWGERGLTTTTWTTFANDLRESWREGLALDFSGFKSRAAKVFQTLSRWNKAFKLFSFEAVLCEERTSEGWVTYSIYFHDVDDGMLGAFKSLAGPSDVAEITVLGPSNDPPDTDEIKRLQTVAPVSRRVSFTFP